MPSNTQFGYKIAAHTRARRVRQSLIADIGIDVVEAMDGEGVGDSVSPLDDHGFFVEPNEETTSPFYKEPKREKFVSLVQINGPDWLVCRPVEPFSVGYREYYKT